MDIINQIYGNKLRIRVSGILIVDNAILLVKHHFNGHSPFFWAPPGGGMQFGESAEQTLKREFFEETGLTIEIIQFLFVHEYLHQPLHAIELFFEVKLVSGELITGYDPEMSKNDQIIVLVQFVPFNTIHEMDKNSLHQLFSLGQTPEKILSLTGYLKI